MTPALNYEGMVMKHAKSVGVARRCPEHDAGLPKPGALRGACTADKPCFFAKIRHTGQVVAPGGAGAGGARRGD